MPTLRSALKILVVEDENDSRWVIHRILKDAGHSVTAAASGAEALDRVTSGAFDLAVVDIGLPDFTGFELLQRMRAIREIRAIALTGFNSEADLLRSRESGFIEHLTKPIEAHMLQDAVARAAG